MKSIRKLYETIRDKVFGRTREPITHTHTVRRLDQGPATQKYVKRCFPRGVFTKTLNRCRRKQVRDVMRRLRPEQQVIARRFGYTKGLDL